MRDGLHTVDQIKWAATKILPAIYDESLSYYEVLCRVIEKLNEVIDNENTQDETIAELMNGMSDINDEIDDIHDDIGNINEDINGIKDNIEDINTFLDDIANTVTQILEEYDGYANGKVLGVVDGEIKWVNQSGGGGTTDYNDLSNKPKINNVTLTGNKSLEDLGIDTLINEKTELYDRVTGSIATFISQAADVPLKDLKLYINPVQNLNGYNNPWLAGGGKNKLDPTTISQGTISGTGANTTASNVCRTDFIAVTAGQAYTASIETGKEVFYVFYYGTNDTSSFISREGGQGARTLSFTPSSGTTYIRLTFGYPSPYPNIAPTDITQAQLETGSTATTFAPYSNVCPITGFTEVSVTHTGENIWDGEYITGLYSTTNGTYTENDNRLCTKNYIPVTPGASIYVTTAPAWAIFYNANKQFVSAVNSNPATVPNNAAFMMYDFDGNYGNVYKNDIVITTTVPNIYNINWNDEAGTVYCGTLDVTTGVLTITKILASLKWSDGTNPNVLGSYTRKDFENAFSLIVSNDTSLNTQYCINNIGIPFSANATSEISHYYVASNNLRVRLILPTETSADFVFQVTGILLTPQTYQLTPVQITTLLGTNNIWHDANGNTELEYWKNSGIAIQEKLDKGYIDLDIYYNENDNKWYIPENILINYCRNYNFGIVIYNMGVYYWVKSSTFTSMPLFIRFYDERRIEYALFEYDNVNNTFIGKGSNIYLFTIKQINIERNGGTITEDYYEGTVLRDEYNVLYHLSKNGNDNFFTSITLENGNYVIHLISIDGTTGTYTYTSKTLS